jgi:two-component system cell cycle sensor histidine kinase/response regulator CckA
MDRRIAQEQTTDMVSEKVGFYMNERMPQFVIKQLGAEDGAPWPSHMSPRNEIERIQLLNDIANDIKNILSLEKKLLQVTNKAKVLLGADIAFVCMADKDGKSHTVNAVAGDITVGNQLFGLPIMAAQADTSSGTDDIACSFINLAMEHLDTKTFSEQLREFDITFGVAVPLQVKTRHLGFLFAGNRKPVEFTPTEQSLLSLVGNLLAAEIDRKRVEEDQVRLETVLEQAAETIMITDRDGFIQYVNPGFEAVSGYTRREVVGRRPQFLQSGHHTPDFYKKMWDELKTGKVWRGHLVNKRKNGSTYELDATISPVKNNEGEITHFVSVRKDITEEIVLRKQLYQAQKMEAIGTLAGGIAHDFNNLLMGIQGNVSLMRMEMPPTHTDQKRCETIESYIKRGADLTRQLLGIARGGKYQQVPTDITKIVNANLNMFGRTRKEIQIHTASGNDPCIAEVDPGQIDQVLLNLFVNAWQAMPNGGHLYVETRLIQLGNQNPRIAGLKPGNYVKITVTDSGLGMKKSVMDRIFDPFFTTRGKSRGTGLGLASVYGIIKNHGGNIQVQSEPGKGTSFVIMLPASTKASPEGNPEPDNIAGGKETILLVDDEEMVVEICSEILKRLGYHVIVAMNGETALSTFKSKKDEIDLVILDLIMPGMNGRQVYDKLVAMTPNIKVLLASGYALDDQARELLSRGANGFIQKPYSVTDLSRKVRQILPPGE